MRTKMVSPSVGSSPRSASSTASARPWHRERSPKQRLATSVPHALKPILLVLVLEVRLERR